MKKLTDSQKTEICKLFYGGEKTKSELARSFNVSHTAISKILEDDKVSASFKKLSDETSEKQQLSMIAYLESKKGLAQELIDVALDGLKGKIAKASLKDTVSAIEKLSTVFKDSASGENGANGELKIVVEKRIVDLSKGDDNGDNQL